MTERNEGRGPEKGPFFKFVYSRHALEDAPQVWERLRDCDVILLENILPDETEKVAGNKLLREAVGNKAKKNGVLSYYRNRRASLIGSVVTKALEKGKLVQFIDEPEYSLDVVLTDAAKLYAEDSNEKLMVGSPITALALFKQHIKSSAVGLKGREDFVAREVGNLWEMNKAEWKGKKIAVFQGVTHTHTYHAFRRAHPDLATVKVMPEPRYSFPYFTWADRKAAFKPEKTMDDVEYIRPMLVTFLMIPLLIGESPTATEIFDAAEKGGRIMKKLDDYEITRYWQQILTQAWRFQEAKGGYSANDPVKMRYKLGLIRIGRELIEKAVE